MVELRWTPNFLFFFYFNDMNSQVLFSSLIRVIWYLETGPRLIRLNSTHLEDKTLSISILSIYKYSNIIFKNITSS